MFASALQAPQEPSLEFGKVAVVHSGILNEDRWLNVFLPAGDDAGTQKYPVIYLLDGGNARDVGAHQPVQRDALPEQEELTIGIRT